MEKPMLVQLQCSPFWPRLHYTLFSWDQRTLPRLLCVFIWDNPQSREAPPQLSLLLLHDFITVCQISELKTSSPPSPFTSAQFVTVATSRQNRCIFSSVQILRYYFRGTLKIWFQPTGFLITTTIKHVKAFCGSYHMEPNGHLLLHLNHKVRLCIAHDYRGNTSISHYLRN